MKTVKDVSLFHATLDCVVGYENPDGSFEFLMATYTQTLAEQWKALHEEEYGLEGQLEIRRVGQ